MILSTTHIHMPEAKDWEAATTTTTLSTPAAEAGLMAKLQLSSREALKSCCACLLAFRIYLDTVSIAAHGAEGPPLPNGGWLCLASGALHGGG